MSAALPTGEEGDRLRFEAVTAYARRVLQECRDSYRDTPVPLLADGIDVRTKSHLAWRFEDGRQAVMSNLASQQNFLRVLIGLGRLTGDAVFTNAAKDAVRYCFDHYQSTCGLMHWGGHRFVDLRTLEVEGAQEKGDSVHELKNHLPFYELMHEVDAGAMRRYVLGMWNGHVIDWSALEINRHASYGLRQGRLWASPYEKREPFAEAEGLSFMNAGNDFIYSAGMLYRLAGEKGALLWMKRLAAQYYAARDPVTRLGAYQFTRAQKCADTDDDEDTLSFYGDRALRQLGPELGEAALEGRVLFRPHAEAIYCDHTLTLLRLHAEIGPLAAFAADWVKEGLLAYARHAYVPEANRFRPMMTDGRDMSGFELRRNGYYGRAGQRIEPYAATGRHLLAYVRGFRATQEPALWQTARAISRGLGLGDIGVEPRGGRIAANEATTCSDHAALHALLDLHAETGEQVYLSLARRVGDNILASRHHHGYFMPHAGLRYASIDAPEALALVALHAAIQGDSAAVPAFVGSRGFFHSNYAFEDGRVEMRYAEDIFSGSATDGDD